MELGGGERVRDPNIQMGKLRSGGGRDVPDITQQAGHCTGLIAAGGVLEKPQQGLGPLATGGAHSCGVLGARCQPSLRELLGGGRAEPVWSLAGGVPGTCPGNKSACSAGVPGVGARDTGFKRKPLMKWDSVG